MADKTLDDFTEDTAPSVDDYILMWDNANNTTKKVSIEEVLGLFNSTSLTNALVAPSKLATGAATNLVATSETLATNTFTDLATVGPAVTVDIGANGLAIVNLYSQMSNSGAGGFAFMGFAVSGASTVAAADNYAISLEEPIANYRFRVSGIFLVTGLTPGSNTFTAKYRRATSGTSTWLDRRIAVVPL